MIEINGWTSINFSVDGEVEMPSQVIFEISRSINALASFNQLFQLTSLNGRHFLLINLYHNHDAGYSELVYKLLTEICEAAPGSYGVVHIRDDDGNDHNKFKILKVAKGKLSLEDDVLLSPCNPTIED